MNFLLLSKKSKGIQQINNQINYKVDIQVKKMEKQFIRITFLIAAISALSYIIFIFLKYYNSPENIEERCTVKFQKNIKKGIGKSDEEWGLNMDKANDNYFKCMKIP